MINLKKKLFLSTENLYLLFVYFKYFLAETDIPRRKKGIERKRIERKRKERKRLKRKIM